jgi:hypothetical protein
LIFLPTGFFLIDYNKDSGVDHHEWSWRGKTDLSSWNDEQKSHAGLPQTLLLERKKEIHKCQHSKRKRNR